MNEYGRKKGRYVALKWVWSQGKCAGRVLRRLSAIHELWLLLIIYINICALRSGTSLMEGEV